MHLGIFIGVNGTGGYKVTPETRAKLRAAHLGKPLSPEHRAAIVAANKRRKKNNGTIEA